MSPDSGSQLLSYEPAHPERLVFSAPAMSASELEMALERCHESFPTWSSSAPARSAALTAFAAGIEAERERLRDLIVREVGKPLAEADAEVIRAAEIVRYFAQRALDPIAFGLPTSLPNGILSARRVPLGTTLLVCPWNFPLAIPIWKAAPALAYGNTVLLKPASAAIGVGSAIAEIAAETLPPGVLELALAGGGEVGALLDDERVAALSFTGSSDVGASLIARLAARGASVQAEMGGHNPAIVLADAELERAADLIVAGATGFAGQKCTATRRVIAVESVKERLVELLADRWCRLGVGEPTAAGVTVGPLIDRAALADFDAALEGAIEGGGEVLARAEAPSGEGWYCAPALVLLEDPAARANQEETFGPLLTVLGAADDEEAVRIANATPYGLVGAVHGYDLERASRLAARLDCGMQRVNASTTGADYNAPFGGTGASSFGPAEQGLAAREFYTEWRTLLVSSGR